MAIRVPRTRVVTLHRLWRTPADRDGLLDVLDLEQLDELENGDLGAATVAGHPGLWVEGTFRTRPGESAEWCAAARRTTGRAIHFADSRSAGLLLLIVDSHAYALGYGQGHRLLPSDQKDRRFGLEFATRALDPKQIHKLLRRRPGSRGRTEVTLMSSGSPIWAFDVADTYADLVGRASGKSETIQLTHSNPQRPTPIDGGVGLRIRLATESAELVADIQTIAGVLDLERRSELEFIDRIRPVHDDALLTALDPRLEAMLGASVDEVGHELSCVVPMELAGETENILAYKVRLGAGTRMVHEMSLADLLNRAHILRAGTRLDGFREGKVQTFSDEAGTELIAVTRAIEWLEAVVSLDPRHFAIVDGDWYEIDADYRDRLRELVQSLLDTKSDLVLPKWRRSQSEREYNESAAIGTPLICLDRKGVKDEFHRQWGFEACDLLGPDNEFIHVKRASGSAPLSHLFNQACVAVQGLEGSATARTRFRELVRRFGNGRELPTGFLPTKIVFAILLKDGDTITTDTLFPFAQIALVQAARVLQSARLPVEVEVRAIELTD